MNHIYFTKKHIIISAGIGLLLLFFILGSWFLLISPKMSKLAETNGRLSTLSGDVTKVEMKYKGLSKNPSLIDSKIVTDSPIISNGLELEAYFKELKAVGQNSSIEFKNIKFVHTQLFPEAVTAEKQVQQSEIGFDVIGVDEQSLIHFVDQLEQGTRLVKIQNVTYRASETTSDSGSYAYSASIIAEMYSLSQYETGKAIDTSDK